MAVGVIVVAAGKGKRLKSRVDKPFVRLKGKPLLQYCLEVFQKSRWVQNIVLVVGARRVKSCRRQYGANPRFPKICNVVAGGDKRQQSVAAGLNVLPADVQTVLVHDAARPFVQDGMLRDVVRWAKKGFGVTVGLPASATIKKVNPKGIVLETPERNLMWEIQTPQGFPRAMLVRAHEMARRNGVRGTDDAGLVERIGARVKVIQGSHANIKITTPQDLSLAKILLENRNSCA